jgi:hypothetical protein
MAGMYLYTKCYMGFYTPRHTIIDVKKEEKKLATQRNRKRLVMIMSKPGTMVSQVTVTCLPSMV